MNKPKTAREIAHEILAQWYLAADIGNCYISEKSGAELESAITAAIEKKDREHAISGQCMMEDRDNAVSALAEAVKLLEPFADCAKRFSKDIKDDPTLRTFTVASLSRISHCRAAAAFLAKHKPEAKAELQTS
jgi:hypothetical protein